MSWTKDGALEAIRKVHEQMGDLEDVLADLEECLDLVNELMDAIRDDIRHRDKEALNG